MSPSTFPTNNWRWLRTYYFEPCKDALILDGAWPAIRSVCSSKPDSVAYFQRDWVGGPNVLIGIYTDTPNVDANDIADRLRAYVRDHPSNTRLSNAEVSRRMESLRVQENKVDVDLLAPQPNNSVRIEAGEPYSPFLTQDALKAAVREFLGKSSEFAVQWLTSIRAGTMSRNEICLRVMVALAWLADPEGLRSHLSFSSHAQAFLRVRDRDGHLARVFAAKYEGREGEAVRVLLKECIQTLRCAATHPTPLSDFVALLRATMADIYSGLGSGRYRPVSASALVGDPDRGTVNYSRLIELLDTQPALRAWQITISLLYQMLNQLGMPASERFLACYLLSRAAEDLFEQPADTIYRNLNDSGDPRDMFTFFADLDSANAVAV